MPVVTVTLREPHVMADGAREFDVECDFTVDQLHRLLLDGENVALTRLHRRPNGNCMSIYRRERVLVSGLTIALVQESRTTYCGVAS